MIIKMIIQWLIKAIAAIIFKRKNNKENFNTLVNSQNSHNGEQIKNIFSFSPNSALETNFEDIERSDVKVVAFRISTKGTEINEIKNINSFFLLFEEKHVYYSKSKNSVQIDYMNSTYDLSVKYKR